MRTIGLLLLASVGCVGVEEAYLRWQAGPPSARFDAKVALNRVSNLRPAGRGDRDLLEIGREKSAQGVSSAVRLDGELNLPLDRAVIRLTVDAMKAAALAPTQPEDSTATAHLDVEIHEFWCETNRAANVSINLELVLLDPPSGAERLRVPLTVNASAPGCRAAFRTALTAAYHELTHALAEEEVHTTALGKSPGAVQ